MSAKSSLVALLALAAATEAARAQDIVAVVSSESAPYEAALAGVQDVLGSNMPVVDLTKAGTVPPASVFITVGGKATLRPYPPNSTIIYCVALGVVLGPEQHPGRRIKVSLA